MVKKLILAGITTHKSYSEEWGVMNHIYMCVCWMAKINAFS